MNPGTIAVLNRLEGIKKGSGDNWIAWCPAHADKGSKQRGLSVSEKQGTLVLHCFSGCDGDAILQAIGLTWGDVLNGERPAPTPRLRPSSPATHRPTPSVPEPTETGRIPFELTTPGGELVAVHTRIEYSDGSKRFTWSRNGKPNLDGLAVADVPLWGIAKVRDYDYEMDPHCTEPYVVLTEGEKAALSLWERGIPAVGTATGASACPSHKAIGDLDGLLLYLWPDNDPPGRKHMDAMARLRSADWPFVVQWPEAPPHGDAADFPGDAAAVWDLLADAVPWAEPQVPADGANAIRTGPSGQSAMRLARVE